MRPEKMTIELPHVSATGRNHLHPVALVAFCLLCAAANAADSPPADSSVPLIDAYIAEAAETIDDKAADALTRIHGSGQRLLALRSYLRDESLMEHWSWTDEQIAAYMGSEEQRALEMGIEKVRREFETRNPGFTLFVNPEVRSLERQLAQWNRNKSVAVSSAALERMVVAEVHGNSRLQQVTPASTRAFIALIKQLVPRPAPNLAAPGLSRHGQMRAVDFQVRKGFESVAEADSSMIASRWQAQGWATRLHSAVLSSGAPFKGPLVQPDEPWHYEYRPDDRT